MAVAVAVRAPAPRPAAAATRDPARLAAARRPSSASRHAPPLPGGGHCGHDRECLWVGITQMSLNSSQLVHGDDDFVWVVLSGCRVRVQAG
jgi:hypothetical protein